MHSTPAHKQTDPDKLPGQIVNPIPAPRVDVTVGDYIRRKHDSWEAGQRAYAELATAGVSAEEKAAVLGEAFCARIFDGVNGTSCNDFKPGRDVPQGWDHV